MRYILQYALELCIVVAGRGLIQWAGILLMCLTTYWWLRRGDHIGR